jgi:glycosyltransferase involved in cell wall biosynthesis
VPHAFSTLVILESHPVQYHAPVYRTVNALGVPIVALYGSDCSVTGYRDREFGTEFAWDTDLLSGYQAHFLNREPEGNGKKSLFVRLRRRLKQLDPAAVMLLGYGTRFDRMAILAALSIGRPILFRAETTDHAGRRGRLAGWLRDSVLRAFYRRCRRLLYIGSRSLAHYRRLGCPEDRLVFSPYCVDTTPFRTSECDRAALRDGTRAQLGIGPDRIVLLFSGKLVPRKGVGMLPAAVRCLPPELAGRIVLAFLGEGELRLSLQQATVRSPAIETRFLGFQNQSKLSAFYHAADLLVLPSRQDETWGLVVNEALHHGLPCVVTEMVGCAPDLVQPGETGEWCRADDAADLAAGIERATRLIGQSDIRDRCRAAVADYTVEAAARGIVTAFRSGGAG